MESTNVPHEGKNLEHTHRHLTRVFTGVVFIIVMVVGISFLSAKYVTESRNQQKEISQQINLINTWIQNDEEFFAKYAKQKLIEEIRKFKPWDIRRNQSVNGTRLSFFVLDEENNLIFKEILQEPRFDDINFDITKIYSDHDTFIFSNNIDENKIVFYQNIRYSLSDVVQDILLLLLLSSILSVLVYFIGYRFVGKALTPVRENIKDMSDFIHNAGHELKTPLAVMRWNLQIMQAEKKYDSKLLKSSIVTIDNANMLIEWLRELSEAGKVSGQEKINLPEYTRGILAEFIPQMKEKNITLEMLLPKTYFISANKSELEIVLKNIIKNAILYNKQAGKIMVKTEKNTLTIIDTWIGIAPENLDKIFDRLYREWEARDAWGYGIWLSMVKKIVDANGWKIHVKSEKWNGTRFEITF